MKNVIIAAILALSATSANAFHWYQPAPQDNASVNANGRVDSTARTSGSTSNYGTGHKEAVSGAYNSSTAGAVANFSSTTGTAWQTNYTTDITDVTTKIGGKSVEIEGAKTGYHSYGRDSGTLKGSIDYASYKGTNVFHSTTKSGNRSDTIFSQKTAGVTTNASSVGGSFGTTLGYGSKTNSSYGGSAGAWGTFNLNAYKR